MAYWEGIPMGKEDRPVLVFDPSAPLAYDINDANGDWYMLKPEFLGCMVLPFSKRMSGQEGQVEFDGKPVNYVLETMAVQGVESWWLAGAVRFSAEPGASGILFPGKRQHAGRRASGPGAGICSRSADSAVQAVRGEPR